MAKQQGVHKNRVFMGEAVRQMHAVWKHYQPACVAVLDLGQDSRREGPGRPVTYRQAGRRTERMDCTGCPIGDAFEFASFEGMRAVRSLRPLASAMTPADRSPSR